MKSLLFVILAFFSGLTLASGSHEEVLNADQDTVRNALVKTLTQVGCAIASSDDRSGTITTEWIPIKTVGFLKTGLRTRSIIMVERLSATTTKVTEVWTYQEQIAKDLPWQPTAPPATAQADSVEFFKMVTANLK